MGSLKAENTCVAWKKTYEYMTFVHLIFRHYLLAQVIKILINPLPQQSITTVKQQFDLASLIR